MLVMYIIAHFFPNFWKFPEAVITKNRSGEEEEGQEAGAEGGVKVDEER